MPFSIVLNGFPTSDVPVTHVQGAALQGMFLHLMREIDPDVAARLHKQGAYRPYTLSPLGIGERGRLFKGFKLPVERTLRIGTPCYLRITLLEDELFPTFSRYFLSRSQPTFRLGETEFTVTTVLATSESGNDWSRYVSYEELIERIEKLAGYQQSQDRRIKLWFVTPTSFNRGDIDVPLPLPRLVFQSYLKRFQEFCDYPFLSDVIELVDQYTMISSMQDLRTDTLKTKRVRLTGFTGNVTFEVLKTAPPELFGQMRLLTDFAFFCGTGKKTTVGMGQTVSMERG